MRASRIFVKCLAVVVGLVGISWALGGPAILIWITTGPAKAHPGAIEQTVLKLMAACAAILGVIGYLIARQCWIHFRRPDRATANGVAGYASFLLGAYLFFLATKYSLSPRSAGLGGSLLSCAVLLGVYVASHAFYKYGLKRMTARAFPPMAAVS